MIREDEVLSGVAFLQHPQVQNSALSERLAFLEGKGLTVPEVEEALRRTTAPEEADGPVPGGFLASSPWMALGLVGAGMAAGGAGAYLAGNYFRGNQPQMDGPGPGNRGLGAMHGPNPENFPPPLDQNGMPVDPALYPNGPVGHERIDDYLGQSHLGPNSTPLYGPRGAMMDGPFSLPDPFAMWDSLYPDMGAERRGFFPRGEIVARVHLARRHENWPFLHRIHPVLGIPLRFIVRMERWMCWNKHCWT